MIDYSTDESHEQYKINRSVKYSRQKESARIAKKYTGHKVISCMYKIAGAVQIKFSLEKKRAFYSGLATCGSVWDCPICSAKISARRGEEINEGVNNWIESGGAIVMITYTLRHNLGDRLENLSRVLTDGIRFVHSGAPYARFKKQFGVKGSITATEVLYNSENGWHIHKHQILFIDRKKINTPLMQIWLYERYERYLESKGYSSVDGVGVVVSDLVTDKSTVPGYITKWGIEKELTALDHKVSKGYTPFELLDNPENEEIYAEYSRTMYGKRRLVWSRGLRSLLGLGIELSDEELAEQQELLGADIVVLRNIEVHEWHYIREHGLRCQVLEKAEQGEEEFFYWYLEKVLQHCSDL